MTILKGVKITNIVKKILKNKLSWFDHREKVIHMTLKQLKIEKNLLKNNKKIFFLNHKINELDKKNII